jgi:hypothetical protein
VRRTEAEDGIQASGELYEPNSGDGIIEKDVEACYKIE